MTARCAHTALLGTLLCGALYAQHTPITSQYLFNGLVINPAYAGSTDALTGSLSHRQQWVGMEGAPTTQVISLHAPIKDRPLAIGALLNNDRIGVTNTTELRGAIAYRLPMRKGKLQLGIGIGAALMQSRWTELALQDRTDVQFATDTRGRMSPTFSGGGYYYNKKWFLGLSVPAFLTQRFDAERTNWRTTHAVNNYQPMLTGGLLIPLDRHMKLKPSALIRYSAGSGIQADLNMQLILRNRLWAGLSYRTSDAMVAMVQVLPSTQWRIGYSYDMGLSALRRAHYGSHEIFIQYTFGFRVRVYDPRFF